MNVCCLLDIFGFNSTLSGVQISFANLSLYSIPNEFGFVAITHFLESSSSLYPGVPSGQNEADDPAGSVCRAWEIQYVQALRGDSRFNHVSPWVGSGPWVPVGVVGI